MFLDPTDGWTDVVRSALRGQSRSRLGNISVSGHKERDVDFVMKLPRPFSSKLLSSNMTGLYHLVKIPWATSAEFLNK